MNGPFDVTWGQYAVIIGVTLAIIAVVLLIEAGVRRRRAWWRSQLVEYDPMERCVCGNVHESPWVNKDHRELLQAQIQGGLDADGQERLVRFLGRISDDIGGKP